MLKLSLQIVIYGVLVSCCLSLSGCDDLIPEQSLENVGPITDPDEVQAWIDKISASEKSSPSKIFRSQTKLSEQQFVALLKTPYFKILDLPQTDFDLRNHKYLATSAMLEELTLRHVTYDSQNKFIAFDGTFLKKINFAKVTNAHMFFKSSRPFYNLETLRFGDSDLTDESFNTGGFMSNFKNFSNLKFLILTNAKIQGHGLVPRLAELHQLESLYLSGNPLDPSFETELKKAMPKLHTDW
jgi:hypothetical protein